MFDVVSDFHFKNDVLESCSFVCWILNGLGEARHGLKCVRGRKNQGFQGLEKIDFGYHFEYLLE